MVSCKDRYTDRNIKTQRALMVKNPYMLEKAKVLDVLVENHNTVSIWIETDLTPLPGQYVMFYAFGRGEAPITVASYRDGVSLHTIRIVGDVTGFFREVKKGDTIYLRGPYGNTWGFEEAYGRDILIVSGGLGLAATRWLIESVIERKNNFRSVVSVYGSKSYEDLLYRDMYDVWSSLCDFRITISNPHPDWTGRTGLITRLVEEIDNNDMMVFICGPDPMVKAVVDILSGKGVSKSDIKVSLERHMKCSVGTCGHCMFGPYFVCKDGPVFRYAEIEYFFTKKAV